MKAMIFAAGLGTRLRPLTDHTPKALVPIAGKTMLERVILRLKDAGFNDITINIHLSDERDRLLDTGGGIKKARPFLDGNEPFLVHNADIICDVDLAELYRHHRESNAEATLLVSERQTSRYLLLDDDNLLHGWINKSTGETKPGDFVFQEGEYREMAFGGIHVISPSIFRQMESAQWEGKFSIIPFYLSVCKTTRIQGYPLQSCHWFDIGKPETLEKAENYLIESALK